MTANVVDINTAKPTPVNTEQVRGQLRMAERLGELYADRLIHVAGLGWFYWTGSHWAEDDTGQAKRAVIDVLKIALANSLNDKTLRPDVDRCSTNAGVEGVLGLAAALDVFAVKVKELDADPYLLNCQNGTLDLETFELRAAKPSDRITKVAGGSYDPDAQSDLWDRFLATSLPDAAVREFLHRYTGLGAVGMVIEHVLAILTGTGRNGKGVFYTAISHALGDYAAIVEPDLFLHRQGAHPTGEMDLRGLRWAVVSETERDRKLAVATVKRLTGGDPIKARRMRKDFVQFDASHTAALITNHLPKVPADDPALWARLRVVSFDKVIPRAEQDPHLPTKLRGVADAILAWVVQGWRDYVNEGLNEPESVRSATTHYRDESDAVRRFVEERCLTGGAFKTTTAGLYDAWETWRRHDGADEVSQKQFGLDLDRMGFATFKTNGRRVRALGLLDTTTK